MAMESAIPANARLPENPPLSYIGFMRTLLALVLSLSIPLQGIAGVLAPAQAACPMEQTMQMAGTAADNAGHGCCNDADTFAKTGKLCKTAQQCLSVGVFMVAAPQMATLPTPGSRHISTSGFFVRTLDLSSVWRPPTPV